MYEPYGYLEEGDYLSRKSMLYNEIERSRAADKKEFHDIDDLYERHETEAVNSAYYDNDLESIIFKNLNGDAISSIKMTDIFPSKLVKSAIYDKDTQHLIITFDNDDKIDIDLNDLINNLEAGDGLILNDAKFSVLIDSDSEKFVSGTGESFLTVGASGVKINHIQEAIDVEKDRAISAETLERNTRIEQDNILLGLINAEKARAIGEETRIDNTIGTGFTTGATETVTQKYIDLSNRLTQETTNRTTQDNQLQNNIETETTAREGEIARLETVINTKANSSNVYVKSQVYTKTESDDRYQQKGNYATTSDIATLLARIQNLENRVSALEG